jgi:hypothetical protein
MIGLVCVAISRHSEFIERHPRLALMAVVIGVPFGFYIAWTFEPFLRRA